MKNIIKKHNLFILLFLSILIISLYSINLSRETNITTNNTSYLADQTTKTIYVIEGDESSTSGDGTEANPYQSIEYAVEKASNGDTIKLLEDIVYRQPAANVNFIIDKNITIDGNSRLLSFRGSNLELLANVEFKNITLNIIPDGSSTTKIYASGNEVTFNNVSTLISQAQSSERPTIIGGAKSGSTSGTHTKINIINGSSETRFKEIIAGKENADSSIPVTITIDSEYSKVDNGINLGGSSNYKVTGAVNITTNSKNIKNINGTNSTNDTITITDSTIYNMELTDIKNITLQDNADVTLNNLYKVSGDINLKQGTKLWINTPGELEITNLKGNGELIISTDTNLLVKGNIVDSANIKLNGFESSLISNLNKIYIEVSGTINQNTNVSLYLENEYYLLNKEGNKYRLIENNGFDKNNIQKIEVTTNPTKLSYKVGETIDISGLILKLTDTNNNTMLVDYTNIKDYNITYTPTTKLTTNDKIITIKSGDIKTTISIVVTETTPETPLEKKDNQKYTPTIESKTISVNEKIAADSFITNKEKLPSKTSYTFEKQPDFSKIGTQDISIIITYPDKSTTILKTSITIVNNDSEEKDKIEESNQQEILPETPSSSSNDSNITSKDTEETNIEESKEADTKTSQTNKIIIIIIIILIICISTIIVLIKLKKNKVKKEIQI